MTKIESLLKKHQEWENEEPGLQGIKLKNFGSVQIELNFKNLVITEQGVGMGEDRKMYIPIEASYDLYSFLNDLFQEEKVIHREEIS